MRNCVNTSEVVGLLELSYECEVNLRNEMGYLWVSLPGEVCEEREREKKRRKRRKNRGLVLEQSSMVRVEWVEGMVDLKGGK